MVTEHQFPHPVRSPHPKYGSHPWRLASNRGRRGYSKAFIFICAVTIVLSSSFVFAVERKNASGPDRYMVFRLKHISGEQGKNYLAEAMLGTVSQLPNSNTLLVTAQPRELIKARAVLELVDSSGEFVIKAICPASEAKNLPPNSRIAAAVGDISIGTFSAPPDRDAEAKAIIDSLRGAVVAVAPASHLERIIFAVEQMQKIRTTTPEPATLEKLVEPNQAKKPRVETITETEPEKTAPAPEPAGEVDTTKVEQDELFGKLLDSLAEAEKMAAEPRQLEAKEIEPKTKAPSEPSAGREQIKQAALKAQEKPQKPSLEAEVTAEEPKPQPEPGPALEEEVVVESEQPGEVFEQPVVIRSYEPEPIPNADEMLELDLPEKLNIVDLLRLVGEYLHLDYMYDPAKVKGEVTLKLRGPIKVNELYPLLESVLKFRGFVMARKGNLVTIVPAGEALNIDPALLKVDGGKVQYGDVIVTRVFDLEYIDTTSAKNLLTGMKLGAHISEIAGTGTLIVTAYAYRMARIEELLDMIDIPGEPKQFRFRQLKYTMAASLAPKVKKLAEELGTVSISISAQQAPAPARGKRRPRRKPKPKPAPLTPTAKATVYLDTDERTNRILMIGLEEQLTVVDELISALDVQQQDLRTLRLYDIQYVGAEEVAEKLGELGITSGGRTSRTRTARRGKAKKKTAAARITGAEEPLVEEPQVVIIEATNSLLVNATAEQHLQIATIISYVDSETLEQAIPYEFYSLENQSPVDVAEVLNKLIQETIEDKTGKIEKVVKEEAIVIIPDEKTFSLIVYASRKNQKWIRSLIEKLDRRRPQVLIDVTLVSVTRTDLFDLDLQLATKFPKLQAGAAMDAVGQIVKPFVGGTGEVFSSPVTAEAKGFYSDAHIQALLTALQTKSYGRVLAKPKILVNDGESGTIKTTDTTNVGIDRVIVPDQGSPQISTSFQAYQAGITLTITPNISEGDLLLLEVSLERSDFGDAPAAGSPPDTTASNIDTIVTVPNNRTIILGGLLKLNQSKGGTKVPLLGDIPILGGLFRQTSNAARDSKLYIFVKANILRPNETLTGLPELERISARNRAAFEKFEDEFQKYEDWPGIKPKPIDPLRILEEE